MVFIASHSSSIAVPRAPARWGMLVLALGAGLAAALLAFVLVRSHTPAGTAASETLSIVVAARPIPARTRLTAAMLQTRSLPTSQVPEGTFLVPAEMVGRITVQDLPVGTALTKEALASPGAAAGLAFALPPSQRAVTIALESADGIDSFACPGDHIDILVTDEPGTRPAETRTVLQNVVLLAVGNQTTAQKQADASAPPAGGTARVTVAVSPVQAEALVLAAARGKIHLSLRSASDNEAAALPALQSPVSPQKPIARPTRTPHAAPHAAHIHPNTIAIADLPVIPLSPLPMLVLPAHRDAVSVTVIKGSQSQTVSVAP